MFPIIELQEDFTIDDEAMGSKSKSWIRLPDGGRWLFKFPRENTGEAWSEKAAAGIAASLNVPHATVELARLNGSIGSLSKRFPELECPSVEMIHGNELLAGMLNRYDKHKTFNQRDHTLRNIKKGITRVFPKVAARNDAMLCLGGYLVLDALIVNTDRHHENWALLRQNESNGTIEHRVAPSYDHASSLGRELLENRLRLLKGSEDRTIAYINKARGAIYTDGKHGANPIDIVRIAHRHEPRFIDPWLDHLRTLTDDKVLGIIQSVPEEAITESAREFAFLIIKHSRRLLLNIK